MKKTELRYKLLLFNSIGERLKFLRGGENQCVYAKLVGVNVPTYCKYEKNIVEPSWRKLKKIAWKHNLTLNDLTDGIN